MPPRSALSAAVLSLLLVSQVAFADAGDLDGAFGAGADGMIQEEPEGSNGVSMGGIAVRRDDRILMAGDMGLMEPGGADVHIYGYSADGLPWQSFGSDGGRTVFDHEWDESVTAIALLEDRQSFLITGNLSPQDTQVPDTSYVARFDPSGELDTTWADQGVKVLAFDAVSQSSKKMLVDEKGRIYIAGFVGANPTTGFVARLTSDGELDDTWGTEGMKTLKFPGTRSSNVYGMTIQRDGRVVVSALAGSGDNAWSGIARLKRDGSYDNTFDGDGRRVDSFGESHEIPFDVEQTIDGKLIVSGQAQETNNSGITPHYGWVARYAADGTPDRSFSDDGVALLEDALAPYTNVRLWDIEQQPDGKILAAMEGEPPGEDTDHGLLRLDRDGSLDDTFAGNSGFLFDDWNIAPEALGDVATELVLDDEGRPLTAGSSIGGGWGVARYKTDPETKTNVTGREKAGKVKVSGFVSPPHAGSEVKLKLQKKVNGNFTNVGSKEAALKGPVDKGRNGTWESPFAAEFGAPGGTCRVKATFPGDDVHDASSDTSKPFAC